MDEHDSGKFVTVQRFDGRQVINYVYRVSGPSGAGFYVAAFDKSTGKYVPTGTKYAPAGDKQGGVDMKNALSVQYNQAGLVVGP
jgi:hypothetical protein